MNSDHELLSFTFPARDFGRLAEKMDVLESHWVGTSDKELRWYACWHVFDPCTLDCVHCGCSRKWDLNENPSAAERANAALLLRLREFFRAIDRPTPWADFEDPDEPDDECSVPIRVVLAPVLRLAAPAQGPDAPAQLPRSSLVGVEWSAGKAMRQEIEEHLAEVKARGPHVLRDDQLFGPASSPLPLTGELESGCICVQERRRLLDAGDVNGYRKIMGKAHPLCPVCSKPAKKPLADKQLVDRLTDAMADKFPDLAAAAGYAMTCPAVELIEVPEPVNAIEAFQQLADAAGGRFDDVDPDALIAEERYDPYPELDDPKPVFWPVPAAAVEPDPAFEVDEGFE